MMIFDEGGNLSTWRKQLYSRTLIIRTIQLAGLFDYRDFFFGPVFFMNINKL